MTRWFERKHFWIALVLSTRCLITPLSVILRIASLRSAPNLSAPHRFASLIHTTVRYRFVIVETEKYVSLGPQQNLGWQQGLSSDPNPTQQTPTFAMFVYNIPLNKTWGGSRGFHRTPTFAMFVYNITLNKTWGAQTPTFAMFVYNIPLNETWGGSRGHELLAPLGILVLG